MISKLKTILRSEQGGVAIEIAFVLPILVVFLLMTVEIGQYRKIQDRMRKTADNLSSVISKMPQSEWFARNNDGSLNQDVLGSSLGAILQSYLPSIVHPYGANVSIAFCQGAKNTKIEPAGNRTIGTYEFQDNQLTHQFSSGNYFCDARDSSNSDNPAVGDEDREKPASCDVVSDLTNQTGVYVVVKSHCRRRSFLGSERLLFITDGLFEGAVISNQSIARMQNLQTLEP